MRVALVCRVLFVEDALHALGLVHADESAPKVEHLVPHLLVARNTVGLMRYGRDDAMALAQ